MANNTGISDNPNSHYGSELIAKEVHDFHGQAIRTVDTRSLINKYFTHIKVEYDGSSNPTLVHYYRGIKAHFTNFDVIALIIWDNLTHF